MQLHFRLKIQSSTTFIFRKYTIFLLIRVINSEKPIFGTIIRQIRVQIIWSSSQLFLDDYYISRKESHPTLKLFNENVRNFLGKCFIILILPKSKQEIRKDWDMAKYQYFGQSKETIPQTDPDPSRPKNDVLD